MYYIHKLFLRTWTAHPFRSREAAIDWWNEDSQRYQPGVKYFLSTSPKEPNWATAIRPAAPRKPL